MAKPIEIVFSPMRQKTYLFFGDKMKRLIFTVLAGLSIYAGSVNATCTPIEINESANTCTVLDAEGTCWSLSSPVITVTATPSGNFTATCIGNLTGAVLAEPPTETDPTPAIPSKGTAMFSSADIDFMGTTCDRVIESDGTLIAPTSSAWQNLVTSSGRVSVICHGEYSPDAP